MYAYREYLELENGARACTAFENVAGQAGEMAGSHWHDAYELLLVQQGRCVQRVGTASACLSPGALTVIRPGAVHSTRALGPCAIAVLQFTPEFSGVSLPSLMLDKPPMEPERLRCRFENLGAAAQAQDEAGRLILSGGVRELCGQILRMAPEGVGVPAPGRLFEQVARYLSAGGDMSLTGAAAHLGYAPEHLSRRFHQEAGMTFREYVDQLRLRRALKLMRSGRLNLTQLAAHLGYADANSFSRAFKRASGMSPGAYMRRRSRAEEPNPKEG